MRWMCPILFLLLLPSGSMLALEPLPNPDKAAKGVEPINGKNGKKKSSAERLDLNQIDLEQVEEEWESTPSKSKVNLENSVKIREIVEPSGEYSYASFGRPDPFLAPTGLMDPGTSAGASVTPEGSQIKIISPLQRYPLSDLNVKGVWQLASGEVRAVILTPKGEGVVVKDGDPISSGKVLSIKRELLTIRLYRLRADGVREYEDVGIKIGSSVSANEAVIKLEPGKDPVFGNPDVNKPMPVVPLSQVLDGPTVPAVPAVPGMPGIPGMPAIPAGFMLPAAKPVVPPVEKGLDPVVPRTLK